MPLKTTKREKIKGKLRAQACDKCHYLGLNVFNNIKFCKAKYNSKTLTYGKVFNPEEEWCEDWEKKHN